MKSCSSATIAIYFLFTLLWVILITHASDTREYRIDQLNDIKTQIMSFQQKLQEIESDITSKKVQQNFTDRLEFLNEIKKQTRSLKQNLPSYKLLNEFNSRILSLIFDHFLTMQDIIILQQTCKEFSTLLKPNEQNMVMYCTNVRTKEMTDVQLMWFDLKYFLNQSYYSAFDPVKMFNIKEHQYTMLTRDYDKQIISWMNAQTSYPQMLFNQARKELYANRHDFNLIQYNPSNKIYNDYKNAWAKITNDGNVVTGGNENHGGDSSYVQSQLKNVKMILSTKSAFGALLQNKKVVVWGDEFSGGKIPAYIQTKLKKNHVKMIVASTEAFAILLQNGDVFAWGNMNFGGEISYNIQTPLQNVKMIVSTSCAFSALLENGNVVVWGHKTFGGIIPDKIQNQLKENVKMIASTTWGIAALLDDGNVLAWGDEEFGGIIPQEIQTQLQNVKMIFSNSFAFVALLQNGNVVAWGVEDLGGKIPADIQTKLKKNVKIIFSNKYAFAALLLDGSVFAWPFLSENENYGGTIPDDIQPKLIKNVTTIFPELTGFTALCKTGEIIKWGFSDL